MVEPVATDGMLLGQVEQHADVQGIWTDFIVENVAASVLGEVVVAQELIKDFEALRKRGVEDPGQNYHEAVAQVVERYGDDLPRLLRALFRRARTDDVFYNRMAQAALRAEFAEREAGREDGVVQQGAIASRAQTLGLRALREQLDLWEGRICAIHLIVRDANGTPVNPPFQGTGFLVGPDLVLTANHVIAEAAKKPDEVRDGDIYAVFDHFDAPTLAWSDPIPPKARKVACAKPWLVCQGLGYPLETGADDPDPAEILALQTALDWALIRLDEPVGRFTRPNRGGRRLWFDLSQVAQQLMRDDRIIIPQHPQGKPQQIDFGRFMREDPSGTRLRYDAETDWGTSGAPCFNQSYALVGLHSSSRQQDGKTKFNQAVRLDLIAAAMAADLPTANAPPDAELWNTTDDPKAPRVVLGRSALQDWIGRAAREPARSRQDRLYAATAKAAALQSGRSFSIEILRAIRRGGEPIVVLGGAAEQIPMAADDFLRAVAEQLGMGSAALKGMPDRPAAALPAGALDGDKLLKWASEDLPRWFDLVLQQHREVVAPAEPPGGEPVRLHRWPFVWIALDSLDRVRLSDEVRNLVAGLTGGRAEEAAMPQTLRRLRWLFLGQAPDFLAADSYDQELLDPEAIGTDEMVGAFQRLADSYDTNFDETQHPMLRAVTTVFLGETLPGAASRLPALQRYFFKVAALYSKEIGIRL